MLMLPLPLLLAQPLSVCICVEKTTQHNFAGKRSCTFETITMAPIQTKVCAASLATQWFIKNRAQ